MSFRLNRRLGYVLIPIILAIGSYFGFTYLNSRTPSCYRELREMQRDAQERNLYVNPKIGIILDVAKMKCDELIQAEKRGDHIEALGKYLEYSRAVDGFRGLLLEQLMQDLREGVDGLQEKLQPNK